MRAFLAGIAAIVFASTAYAAPHPCTYDDLMPAYIAFLDKTKGDTPEQRADAFVNDFAAAHPDFYGADSFRDGHLRKMALRYFDPAQRKVFPGFAPVTDAQVIAMGRVVGPAFAREQQRFVKVFRDFDCKTVVGFGPAFFSFDGHTDDFGGRNHLLFGVDLIAMLHRPADMPAFFDHELFHVYHAQIVSQKVFDNDTGWWNLWCEGLATYVSQRMNPGLDAQQVLWFPSDLAARMEPLRAHAAELLLHDIDAHGGQSGRWFSSGQSVEGLPPRAGYYLGYVFAKHMGDGHPLPQLARYDQTQLRPAAIGFLDELAHGR